MSHCVVTFGKGYNFLRGVERIKLKCNEFNIPFVGFTEYPDGCPLHEDSPYAFKFFCINECIKNGYTNILWLDASVIIKTDLKDVFKFMDDNGYFIIKNWHTVGDYCHDKALKTLNITRDQSFKIPCLQGTNFGLNFKYNFVKEFLNKMLKYSVDGITFPGSFDNKNNEASKHPKVLGHRFDQPAMSVEALRLGMNKWFNTEEHPWFIHDRKYVKDVNSTITDKIMSE